jgi:hypothetical protein
MSQKLNSEIAVIGIDNPDQHDPGRLNEQGAQGATSRLRELNAARCNKGQPNGPFEACPLIRSPECPVI